MYRVLIVDDEMYAVQGIVDGVDWERLDVIEVHEAYNAEEAQGILIEERIDLMICDIQMPVMNGLSLLEWANRQQPELRTIFLTCHAEFRYAQRAMQLGTRDYLLKPVVYEELEAVIAGNLEELNERRLALSETETFRKYYELWHEQREDLIRSFWRDMVNGPEAGSRRRLEQAIRQYDLPLAEGDSLLLILLSVEEWKKPLSAFDEELLNYALRKAAEEVVLGDRRGHVLEDELGHMMIIVYLGEEDAKRPKLAQETWRTRCEAYIEACRRFFYCDASCYVGGVVNVEDIGLSYHELLEMEYGNVTRLNRVHLHEKRTRKDAEADDLSFLQWADSLESGHAERIAAWLQETEAWIRERQGSKEALVKVYHALLQVVYYALLRKGVSPDALHDRGLTANMADATRSSVHLTRWMAETIRAVAQLTSEEPGSDEEARNSMVAKITGYVQDHLHEDITRDEISSHVHLNPSYLSRLFRIKTGLSLSEYILQERMKRAAKLLEDTKGSISTIAKSLGYDNFSYFSKMFKKIHGMTPQEYRRSLAAGG